MCYNSAAFSPRVSVNWMCICGSAAAASGAEAGRGAPSADAVWDHNRKLAGTPHSEGVPQGVFPGAAGHTLPGRWTGTAVSVCLTTHCIKSCMLKSYRLVFFTNLMLNVLV